MDFYTRKSFLCLCGESFSDIHDFGRHVIQNHLTQVDGDPLPGQVCLRKAICWCGRELDRRYHPNYWLGLHLNNCGMTVAEHRMLSLLGVG